MADTSISRAVGLLGRTHLQQDEGIWIKPSSGVHTIGMRFPIDVIGLDKQLRIVRLWPSLKPYRVTAIVPSIRTVLELASGRIVESGLRLGDQLRIQESALFDEASIPTS
ncbi:DUF192 domain-containing protein [Terriglobus sp. TAA 43]|uniref:DUF192 domain-containing protein n=1 Tax=Terriglobus sp. TAA 43 TaxID=278961 RepID=UPI0018DE26AF|nr:DUF192 domain-containing protein [Terriglobus sp. TAA 43]